MGLVPLTVFTSIPRKALPAPGRAAQACCYNFSILRGVKAVQKSIARLMSAVMCGAVAFPTHAGWRDTFIDPQDGMLDASKYLSENRLGFLPVPIIITEPAVGEGLGLAGIFFHETEDQKKQRIDAAMEKGKAILPENISLAGAAFTNNCTCVAVIGNFVFCK
jgi:hypothetical protein